MKTKLLLAAFVSSFIILNSALVATAASTINTNNHYAWDANTGWIDFRAERPNAGDGFHFGEFTCSGYLWSPNLGWINCGNGAPGNGSTYGNNNNTDYGVNHSGGNLSGLAWSPNTGWINFGWAASTNADRPRVDLLTGEFSGYAWSPNCGWLNLGAAQLKTDRMEIVDTDHDGIADGYEMNYAGDLDAIDGTSDLNLDGVTDKQAYITGNGPFAFTGPFRITRITKIPNLSAEELEWPSSPTRIYGLEYRTNLVAGTWQFAGDVAGAQNTNATTAAIAGTLPQIFIRVAAKLPLQP